MFKQTQSLPLTANNGSANPSQDVIEARQETQIWTAYALSPYLRANDLKVTVRNGNAFLSGAVADDVSKDLAKQIALGVDGIKSVDSRIEISANYTPPATSTNRTFGEVVDDATVTSAVTSKLAWSRHADGLIADISTLRGKVTLSGTAFTAEARDAAGKLALNTLGARSVDNELVIRPERTNVVRSIGSDIADGWISAKVKSTLMYSSNVNSSDIAVSTSGGVVQLNGKVNSEAEGMLAVELAGNVRGVKSVDSSALTIM